MNRNTALIVLACITCLVIGVLIGTRQSNRPSVIAKPPAAVLAAAPTATPRPTPTPTLSPVQLRQRREQQRQAEIQMAAERRRQERAERRRQAAERIRLAKAKKEQEERVQRELKAAAERQAEADRTDGVVSLDEYSRIATGMSYSDVMDIIGPGEEMSRSDIAGITTVMYMWQNSDASNMNAMFQNGELIQKAQFGLR